MVTSVTSLGRSGLYDWLIQRITAVVMTAYLVFLLGYFAINSDVTYASWVELHQNMAMKLFSLFTVVSIAMHAWIGLWCVLTDYVTVRLMGAKATPIRIVLTLGMIVVTLVYLVWAVDILWGI